MQWMTSAEKHTTSALEIRNECQARENMQRVASAGKYITTIEREEICNEYRARENM